MDDIQDDVLRKLAIICEPKAKEDPSRPATQLDRLLSAVDLENIKAKDDVLTVHDVPGGSVSFLFQKSSSVLELPSRAGEEGN
jgi:DNA repair and recombination protein RAD54B